MQECEPMPRRTEEPGSPGSLDPAEIAEAVRQIAHELSQMLMNKTWSPIELLELERRIDELRVHTHGTQLIGIDRWLDSSRRALRARVIMHGISIGEKHTGARRPPEHTLPC
jgi:hypothetical protein